MKYSIGPKASRRFIFLRSVVNGCAINPFICMFCCICWNTKSTQHFMLYFASSQERIGVRPLVAASIMFTMVTRYVAASVLRE